MSVPEITSTTLVPDVLAAPQDAPTDLVQRLDRWAFLFSGLCLIHCLALPLIVTLLPVLGGTALGDHRFHQWLLVVILPTSLVALTLGCRRHGAWRVLGVGAVGVLVLAIAALGHELFHLSDAQARWITVLGSLIVATGHLLNYRRCRAQTAGACNHSHA